MRCFFLCPIDNKTILFYTVLIITQQYKTEWGGGKKSEIVVSYKASCLLYEQIATQIKTSIMSGELKAGEAIPFVRALAKSLRISILTVQKAYYTLREDD